MYITIYFSCWTEMVCPLTLKSSPQIDCPWSHEIDAGVLSGTVKTPVYQQGTGTRQYLISKNVSKTKHIYSQ